MKLTEYEGLWNNDKRKFLSFLLKNHSAYPYKASALYFIVMIIIVTIIIVVRWQKFFGLLFKLMGENSRTRYER